MRKYFFICIMLFLVICVYGLTGDINRDGIVDGYDLIALARSFGSMQGDEGFDPSADLTGNKRVDGEDLSLLAANFGRRRGTNNSLDLILSSSVSNYIDPGITDLSAYDNISAVKRYKTVELNPEITNVYSVSAGDAIYLNLFEDKEYTAYIDRTHTYINGTMALRARIHNYHYSYIIIVTTENNSLAIIDLPERNEYYMIFKYPQEKDHILLEKNRSLRDIVESGPPIIVPEENIARDYLQDIEADPYDHADIDMMIVYTPAAASWASMRGGIANIIAMAMERAQLAFDNSNIIASANLVLMAEVDYQESGDSYDDIGRLAVSPDFNPWGSRYDGYMEEVHQWRDASGADLVALFAKVDDIGGLAFMLWDPAGRPELGFSLTRVQQAGSTFTHIHEIGHNMGADHHKEQNSSPGPGIFDYSAGWRWTGNDGRRYCSLMTYGAGRFYSDGLTHQEVGYFSNPNILHFGVPTGHPQHGDNARTLRETKHVIASYRTASADLPEAPTNLSGSAFSTEEIKLEWTVNSVNELGFAIEHKIDGEDHFREIARSSPSASSFILGADPGVQNYYRIRAFNHNGFSSYSNIVEVSIGMGW